MRKHHRAIAQRRDLPRSKRKRNRISRWRRELGWRQLDLARRLDVFQSEVSKIERGEREPGVYLAKRIARSLGKAVEDVF